MIVNGVKRVSESRESEREREEREREKESHLNNCLFCYPQSLLNLTCFAKAIKIVVNVFK